MLKIPNVTFSKNSNGEPISKVSLKFPLKENEDIITSLRLEGLVRAKNLRDLPNGENQFALMVHLISELSGAHPNTLAELVQVDLETLNLVVDVHMGKLELSQVM